MTVFDALVLRSAHQTVIIARTVVPARAAHMRQAGGAELRGALDDHLATNIASASDLSAFLLASGSQPISILRTAELVAAVVAAAESGRLHAYLFREPGYISNADLQALRTKAELAVRRSLAVRPGSPPARPFAELDASDRFIEVLRRTVPRVGPQMARQLREIVEDPAQLTLMVATIVILAQLHAVAAGEVIDGVVLTAIVACAVVEGMGIVQAMVAALEAVANLVDFIITTVGARDYADLDRAAEKLAAGLGAIGVGILSAALARIAGRFRDSLKKAGGQRRIETVTKEEMAGKGGRRGPPSEGAAEPPSKTPEGASSKAHRAPPDRKGYYRSDLDEKWFDEQNGQLKWPDGKSTPGTFEDGFDQKGSFRDVIMPGQKLDRYGSESGEFLSPLGTPFEQRALPYDKNKMPYRQYLVTKPLPVSSGKALPFFDQVGGGRQYKTKMSIDDLISEGFLVEIVK